MSTVGFQCTDYTVLQKRHIMGQEGCTGVAKGSERAQKGCTGVAVMSNEEADRLHWCHKVSHEGSQTGCIGVTEVSHEGSDRLYWCYKVSHKGSDRLH
jgi:hypothetical protein